MNKATRVDKIHTSLFNGQRMQMVSQIDEYGSEFWRDYQIYLHHLYESDLSRYAYFSDATISYFRIKARFQPKVK